MSRFLGEYDEIWIDDPSDDINFNLYDIITIKKYSNLPRNILSLGDSDYHIFDIEKRKTKHGYIKIFYIRSRGTYRIESFTESDLKTFFRKKEIYEKII